MSNRLSVIINICLLLSVFTLCTCRKNKETGEVIAEKAILKSYRSQLIPSELITFNIDNKTSLFNPIIQYFEDNNEHAYFIVRNRISSSLIFYDFATKERAFEVKYEIDDAHGIGELNGATILSLDSVLILGSGSKIYLSDTSGMVKQKYSLTDKSDNQRMPMINYGINHKFVPHHKDILIFSTPHDAPRRKEGLKKPCIIRYDMEEEYWEYIDISYPKTYYQDGYFSTLHFWGSIDRNGDKLIVNFPASDSLIVYENGRITRHLAKSDQISSIMPPGSKQIETSEQSDARILQSPAYFFMRYDPYRKVYYRFLLNKQDDLSSTGDILKMYDEKPCTIIILDEGFKKIGETNLAQNSYHIPDHFIAPEGLYISTNHPDSPLLDEDKLTYHLLKLEYDTQ